MDEQRRQEALDAFLSRALKLYLGVEVLISLYYLYMHHCSLNGKSEGISGILCDWKEIFNLVALSF